MICNNSKSKRLDILCALVLIKLMALPIYVYGLDFENYFLELQSPACRGISLADATVSKCEFDQNLIAQGRCSEMIAIHKIPQLSKCRSIAHSIDISSQFEKLPLTEEGKIVFALLASVHGYRPLSMPDLSPTGPYMPKGECEQIGKELVSRPYTQGFYVNLDRDLPNWRSCMNQLAQSILTGLESDPKIVAIRKVESILAQINLSQSSDVNRVKAFILAIDDEPIRPSLERIINLLEEKSK